MSFWTDAHCHLQDQFLSDDQIASNVEGILARAHDKGVGRVVIVGTDAQTSAEALAVSEIDGPVELFATVGLHPHEANQDVAPIVELARRGHPRLVGIGECGLDYFYEHSPRSAQRVAFSAQIALAQELDLALVVHTRDAFDDLYDIFASEGVPARTVIHCFTGTAHDAQNCLERGCDISFSGIVTFKNADSLREAALVVPLERLHVETDSPFLAPVPYRGRPNEPALVSVVGEFLAELRGEEVSTLQEATSANSARLFGLEAR